MRRTGFADLPLHRGTCPYWLFKRMVKLSRAVVEAIALEYGAKEFLRRLSEPYWFQALGCAIGFDWNSSGLSTTTCGALKEALAQNDLGLFVAGGKGKASRKTPQEITNAGEENNFSDYAVDELCKATRLSAKVDSACVQDGFELYHHSFFFTAKGEWAVVQQGLNAESKSARRYHWLSEGIRSFVEEPHAGIACDAVVPKCLDLTSKGNKQVRKASVDLVKDNPVHLKKYFVGANGLLQTTLDDFERTPAYLQMHLHHEVLRCDISECGWQALQKAYEAQPKNYEQLTSLRGIRAKTLRALALVSELIYGTQVQWHDPVKFSFCVGGKDGFPFPIDRKRYDESISVLRNALESVELGRKEKLGAIKRLSEYALTA